MGSAPRTRRPPRFFLRRSQGIISGRHWAVIDDSVGQVAQTDDGMTLAYYADRQTAREFMWKRNAQHWAGTCPEHIDWHSERHDANRAMCLYLLGAAEAPQAITEVLRKAGHQAADLDAPRRR
jgi:hypothetical protein